MRNQPMLLLLAVLALLAAGCSTKNPTAPEHHDDTFTFELTATPDHMSTLTPITFTLTARNDHGEVVTDFEAIQLERQMEGTTTWRAIALTLQGNSFQGVYTFTTSGDYHFRVMGSPHGGHEVAEMGHIEQHMHVERAHMDAGGYKVEYESYPGHIHEGETPMLKFWVLDDVTGAPIPGLTSTMRCTEQGGAVHDFAVTESGPGVYEAAHLIEAAGETKIALLFTGADSQPATAEFTIEVAHGH